LPGAAQRRLMRAMIGESEPEGWAAWLTPAVRKAIFTVVALLTLAAVGLVCTKAG
jgi:hypothetical protein